MAIKRTVMNGGIIWAATWGGVLPAEGDTCYIDHICSLSNETFDIGATGTLHLNGNGSGILIVAGVCTLIAGTIAEMECLSLAGPFQDLQIVGDCYTTVDEYWECYGGAEVTIDGNYTGGGPAADFGLRVAGTLTITEGHVADGTAYGTGVYTYNGTGAHIVGDVIGTAGDNGIGVFNETDASIEGDVTGTAGDDGSSGIYNYGTLISFGNIIGTAGDNGSFGIYNNIGTIYSDTMLATVGKNGVALHCSRSHIDPHPGDTVEITLRTGSGSKALVMDADSDLGACDIFSYLTDGDLPAEADVKSGVTFGHEGEKTGALAPAMLVA